MLTQLEHMTFSQLLRQLARQIHIYHYREERHEDQTDVLQRLDQIREEWNSRS